MINFSAISWREKGFCFSICCRDRKLFKIVNKTNKLEDTCTKGVIRCHNSKKDRQYNGQKKGTKKQIMIYKTQHRQLKIEQYEHQGDELMISGLVSSSWSNSCTLRVTLSQIQWWVMEYGRKTELGSGQTEYITDIP